MNRPASIQSLSRGASAPPCAAVSMKVRMICGEASWTAVPATRKTASAASFRPSGRR